MRPPKAIALSELRASIHLLASRRFGTFWFSSLLSSIGTWAQQVAEPWLLLTLGASSFVIGVDSFAMNAPVWLLTLAGGALADRADRRLVISFFQSIQMLCPTAIVVLLVMGIIQPWMIIALSVIVGITDALSMPSFQSIVPSIVPHDQIGRGLALNSTQFNLSRILGPSIAGVLMSSFGATACFVVSAASYVPFIGVALWILPRFVVSPPPASSAPQRHLISGMGGILGQPHLRGGLLTVLATGLLCSPLVTFAPVLVRDAFHGSAADFSMAAMAFGAGGVLGALGLLAVAPSVDRRRLAASFAIAYGIVLVATALNPWFWASLALFVLAGAAMTISNTAVNALLQATSSPRLLGQTVSLYMLAMRGGISLGALLTGVTVSALGVKHALLLNGLLAIFVQVAVAGAWLRGRVPPTTPA